MIAELARGPMEILLVEDNPGDVRLTCEALKEARVSNRLHTVDDGVKALDFLRQQGIYAAMPRPDLVLLDLNLPKMAGLEVLREIKQDGRLKAIPVVVLTTSQSRDDIAGSYELHANCYVSKPVDLERFLSVIRSIEMFWLQTAKLPSEFV